MACANKSKGMCLRGIYCKFSDICPLLNQSLKNELSDGKIIVVRLEKDDYQLPASMVAVFEKAGYKKMLGKDMIGIYTEKFNIAPDEMVLVLELERNAVERQKFMVKAAETPGCQFNKD